MNDACSATFVQKFDTYWVKLASDTVMATSGSNSTTTMSPTSAAASVTSSQATEGVTPTESLSTQPVGAGNTILLARVLYWIPMICACGKWLNNIVCSEITLINAIIFNRHSAEKVELMELMK